jgi:hypothetical protein
LGQPAGPGALRQDPTLDLFDWRDLKPALAARGLLAPGTIIATPHWIDAGKINYALAGEFVVLCVSPDPREFAFLQDEQRFAGRDAIIVANATRSDWLDTVTSYCTSLSKLLNIGLFTHFL